MSDATITCDRCGVTYGIGCSPFCRDQHAPVRGSAQYVEFERLFSNYYDEGLDAHITGRDQRRRLMQRMNVDHRERPTPGDLAARRDKVHELRRERARG